MERVAYSSRAPTSPEGGDTGKSMGVDDGDDDQLVRAEDEEETPVIVRFVEDE